MKTTAEKIEVMQAHEDGEVIETRGYHGNSEWEVTTDPVWSWNLGDYRIAPETLEEIWCNMHHDGSIAVFVSEADAIQDDVDRCHSYRDAAVHFREVTEGDDKLLDALENAVNTLDIAGMSHHISAVKLRELLAELGRAS